MHVYALVFLFVFFFNDTATTEIYTLSLHDALPISRGAGVPPGAVRDRHRQDARVPRAGVSRHCAHAGAARNDPAVRSEEHTSELQSRRDLVCRLLLEKKKNSDCKATNKFYHTYVTS